jgi:hypothetical protein
MSTPRAIFSIMAAITREGLRRDLETAEAAADREQHLYDGQVADYRKRLDWVSPDAFDAEIAAMERRGHCGRPGLHSLYVQYLQVRKAVAAVDMARRQAATVKPMPAEVRVAVIDAYAVKDALKIAGYRYARDGHWVDWLGMRVKAAWVKVLPADLGIVRAEVAALRDIGVTCEEDDAVNNACANVRRLVAAGGPA